MDGHRQIEGRQAEAVIASNRTSHVFWLGYGDGVNVNDLEGLALGHATASDVCSETGVALYQTCG
jgi:hypothetical protein